MTTLIWAVISLVGFLAYCTVAVAIGRYAVYRSIEKCDRKDDHNTRFKPSVIAFCSEGGSRFHRDHASRGNSTGMFWPIAGIGILIQLLFSLFSFIPDRVGQYASDWLIELRKDAENE